MKRLHAGKLNQRITLYKPVTGKTASGAPITNKFEKVGVMWAAVELVGIAEDNSGEKNQATGKHLITFRWRPVGKNWICIWRDQIYRVIGVDDTDPQKRQKQLTAETENAVTEMWINENTLVDGAITQLN
jgi:head-tail adaptor